MKRIQRTFLGMTVVLLATLFSPGFSTEEVSYFFAARWPDVPEAWYFSQPVGIAVDPSGNIFVVERDSRKIKKFDSEGNLLLEWGSAGSGDAHPSPHRRRSPRHWRQTAPPDAVENRIHAPCATHIQNYSLAQRLCISASLNLVLDSERAKPYDLNRELEMAGSVAFKSRGSSCSSFCLPAFTSSFLGPWRIPRCLRTRGACSGELWGIR